jgi:hypothetical protein
MIGKLAWITVVVVGLLLLALILLAASVIFALKASGLLPQQYAYRDILVDAIFAPCAFFFALLVVGVAWEAVDFYLQGKRGN